LHVAQQAAIAVSGIWVEAQLNLVLMSDVKLIPGYVFARDDCLEHVQRRFESSETLESPL